MKNKLLNHWSAFVAYRLLLSKSRSSFLSFITLISIGGLIVGVSALIVVLSVMDGFEVQLKKRLLSTDLHLMISPKNGERVLKQSLQESSLAKYLQVSSGVTRVTPVLEVEGILKSEKKMSGILLKGVSDEALTQLKEKLVETRILGLDNESHSTADSKEVSTSQLFLGQELAYQLGVIPGEIVTLISPIEMDGPFSNIPRMKKFVVEGIYRLGLPEIEMHQAYISERSAYSFIREANVVSHYEVVTQDLEFAENLRKKLNKMESPFIAKDWVQMNAHLFASLKLERFGMFLGLLFIVIVASFNIITTLTLMVMEKKKEISILKAMGARDQDVGRIFLLEGAFIGGVGVSGGLMIGLLICFILKKYEFITLPDVYFDRTLPVSILPHYYFGIVLITFIIVLLASIYPSIRASRITPIQGIRH